MKWIVVDQLLDRGEIKEIVAFLVKKSSKYSEILIYDSSNTLNLNTLRN